MTPTTARRGISCLVLALSLTGHAKAAEPLPASPKVPDRAFRLADFHPAGDGAADDTAAVTAAIAAVTAAGGGHLNVGPGRYRIGPIALASNFDLHLEAGATLLARNDIDAYPQSAAPYFNKQMRYTDLITADRCHDVEITGPGTIDGQGAPWWAKYRKHKGPGPQPGEVLPHRPHLVVLSDCLRVAVTGVTLKDSPNFHLVPQQCADVLIDAVTITAPADSPNTDGIDPSGHRVRITRCTINVGDDNIAIKPSRTPTSPAGATTRPAEIALPSCTDFWVSDCHFGYGHGLSIGGQTPGGLHGLRVRDCTFDGTNVGIRMKADHGAGGLVEDCVYERLTMKDVKTAVLITSYYPKLPADPATMPALPGDAKTPQWQHITIDGLTATGSTEAGGLVGLAEMPIRGVTFRDVTIDAKQPMRVVDAQGVTFERSAIRIPSGGPGVVATRADVRGIAVGAWTGAVAPIERTGAPAGVEDAPQVTR